MAKEFILEPVFVKQDSLGRNHCEDGPCGRVLVTNSEIEKLREEGKEVEANKLAEKLTEEFRELAKKDTGRTQHTDVYGWHGIEIPQDDDLNLADLIIINPYKLNPKIIDKIDNVELKRVAIERYGFEKYLLESKAKILDRRFVTRKKSEKGDTIELEELLIQKNIGGNEKITGILVVNSSPNGRFSDTKEKWTPLSNFSETQQKRILDDYENTGELKDINGVLSLRQKTPEGQWIWDLDKEGNFIYKRYFLLVRDDIAPFWFKLDQNGEVCLDRLGEPIQVVGNPQKATVHNAIASTFGLYGSEYMPSVET